VIGNGETPALVVFVFVVIYDYGTRADGSSTPAIITIRNDGETTATNLGDGGQLVDAAFGWDDGAGNPTGAFPGVGGSCVLAGSLATTLTCTVAVVFAPTDALPHADNIDVSYTDGVGPQNAVRAVQGQGAPPATLVYTPATPFGFGDRPIGGTFTQTFTVQNTGGVDATLMASLNITAPFSYTGVTYPGTPGGTPCGASLVPAAICEIEVEYGAVGPPSADAQTASITFDNGAIATNSDLDLTGNSVNPALLAITPAPFTYANTAQGASLDQTFTVTNSGGFDADITAATIVLGTDFAYRGGTYPGIGGDCPNFGVLPALPAPNTCSIIVTYTPTTQAPHADTIQVTYNDGVSTGLTATAAIDGTGIAPAILAYTTSGAFGVRTIGASYNLVITLENTGAVQATALSQSFVTGTVYAWTGGAFPGGGTCGATLDEAGGAAPTCTIGVTYTPAVSGAEND